MKRIGNDVYIQRGEIWSLDFDVADEKGAPLMLLNVWDNPYLAITVAAALYEQKGDFRRTYWLDLSQRWVEQEDGSLVLEPIKRFTSTEPLMINSFDVEEILAYYGRENGGKIVLDKSSAFDVTNYLFFIDPLSDGNYVYKYVKDYEVVDDIVEATWEEYSFRITKQFTTKDWMEQGYLYDIKVLAGESLPQYVARALTVEGKSYDADLVWSDVQTQEYINSIVDDYSRTRAQEVFDSGAPLMPDYDVKSLILQPTRLYVSVNIQGGVR